MSDHPTSPPASDPARGGSMMRASLLMGGLGLLLSWLPIIGPAIAGAVGGREAGTPPRALLVALLPAVLIAVLIGWILTAFDLPVLGAIAGIGIFVVIVVQLAPLLVGAWFGASSR